MIVSARGRLFGSVGLEHSIVKPLKYRRRDDQLAQEGGEAAREDFLARIRLRALSSVAGAMVVNVPPLLQFADKQATAMSAVDQPGERQLVFHLAGAIRGTSIQ